MEKDLKKLEVVDVNDSIIFVETEEKIHQDELLHRDVHVWFINSAGEVIFQHRSKEKYLFPDKLDATVAGHVELGDSYEKTAIKECEEETGLSINPKDLIFLGKKKNGMFNEKTNKFHNTIGVHYAYLYNDQLDDLKIEKGAGEGFESWNIEDLYNLSKNDRNKFIEFVLEKEMLDMLNEAKTIIKN